MVGEAKRAEIRRRYQVLRIGIGKTQIEVETLARRYYKKFRVGLYWKIENGFSVGTDEENSALARVFGIQVSELPGAPRSASPEAAAS